MDCPWRRTFASVFLLLSPHSIRVRSQNVVPTGPLPPLTLIRDSGTEGVGFGPGSFQQPMNNMQPPPEFLPLMRPPSILGSDQYRFGPPFIQNQFTPLPQIPQIPPLENIELIANGLPLQDPACIVPSNANVPAQFSIPQSPFSFPPPLISLPPPSLNIPNTQPQGQPPNFVPGPLVPQVQNCNPPSVVNLPPPQGPPFNISPGPLTLGPQSQIYPGPQALAGPVNPGQSCYAPFNTLQNSDFQNFPPYYAQTCPINPQIPNPVLDFAPATYLPPPSLPTNIPVQNYVPIPPCTPFQPVLTPPLVPMEYFSTVPLPPVCVPTTNFQIAALPPVLPLLDIPQYFEYETCRSPQPAPEEHSLVPINFEINVPSPTMPEPKITVITAFTSPPSTSSTVSTVDSNDISLGLYPPSLPPIIIEEKRSRSRNWLPLILIALFAKDGCGGNCGGCCCPCFPENDIPIPYPIPIPTNNPIILGKSGRSSRNKCSKAKAEKDHKI